MKSSDIKVGDTFGRLDVVEIINSNGKQHLDVNVNVVMKSY